MMSILKFPLTLVCLMIIIGILISDYFQISPNQIELPFAISAIVLVLSYLITRRFQKLLIAFTLFLHAFMVLLGIFIYANKNEVFDKDNYIHFVSENGKQNLIVSVNEILKTSEKYDRYVVGVKQIDHNRCSGKLLLNIKKDSLKTPFSVGENVAFSAIIRINKPVVHQSQFDYGKYLNRKSILAQSYVYDFDQLIKLKQVDRDIIYFASKIRNRIIGNLQISSFSQRELQVLNALILGQQQNIAPDIVKDYQYAGAVHILSVSGLHVGFIVLFINFLFKKCPNKRNINLIKLLVVIFGLLFFAVLAGLSPPVLRAVTMFIFVAFGLYLRRKTNIYYTLIVSMLLILSVSPAFLFDVGFQLSYLALFFIIWVQPILKRLYQPKYKVGEYFWDIITVSFAAQIGTMPLSLYYFHQFPSLFFITNLIILPALGIIMFLGLLVMIIACFSEVPNFLVVILEWFIRLINVIINYIASFEQFVIREIGMNLPMTLLLFLVIICLFKFLEKPKSKQLIYLFVSVIFFQLSLLITNTLNKVDFEIVFFNSKNYPLISLKNGTEVSLFSTETDSVVKQNYELKNYLQYHFAQIESNKPIQNFIQLDRYKVFVLDHSIDYKFDFTPDIVYITNSPKINFDRFLDVHQPLLVIADRTNYKHLVELWRKSCAHKKIPFHSISEKGLLTLK